MRFCALWSLAWLALMSFAHGADGDVPDFERQIAPLLKRHCVKCHGPAKQEGKLNLAVPDAIVRGGQSGAVIIPHDAGASPLWQRVSADEMPPEAPLSAVEKRLVREWIVAGAAGLQKQVSGDPAEHWSFRRLPGSGQPIVPPRVAVAGVAMNSPIDEFIAAELSRDNLTLSPTADRARLIRRLGLDLTGLPPDPESIAEFLSDSRPDAYERMVDRYLASPHFGERMGKGWLDAAGYADSNGYFSADSDRPLAYRYRDYVIRSLNADRPFDEFIREQIAGDELAGITVTNGGTVEISPRQIELLEATHYLRCGQDGTGESDGNPDEVRVDRYTVLETAMQNVSTGLLGLTIQCAKCHDHKFEPLTQRDYYSFQAVLIPAFPPGQWVKPNDRFVHASLPGEVEAWQSAVAMADASVNRLAGEISEWTRQHRPRGTILFSDSFDDPPESLATRWSNTAPTDDAPGGTAAVNLNSREAPAAIVVDGRLNLIEGGPGGDKWLSTRTAFDWTPDQIGDVIQVTFDLVDHHIGESKPAERIGYFLALHDFNDNGPTAGGNILVDGHPSSSTAVFVDYPGSDSRQAGVLGTTGYVPGRNYGVRITNKGKGQYLLQQLVDWQAEDKTITLADADLPNGGFGFEFCCGRSYVVDNVVVESFSAATSETGNPLEEFLTQLAKRRQPLEDAQKQRASLGGARPGKIAWTTDVVDAPPSVHVLARGNYDSPGEPVEPNGFAILGPRKSTPTAVDAASSRGTGRRRAYAEWITEPDSPRAALLSRVHVNRLWQHHFGTGIVPTPDNFGLSGAPPSHPELLEWLARTLIQSDWSSKRVMRQIVCSSTYRQSAAADERRIALDHDGRRLSRFPIRRLDAEAIRDGLLFAAGDLDDRLYGPYIATSRNGAGETIVAEENPGSRRRSIYLQQRRTQIVSLLQVFDAPSIVFNSTRRSSSTMPLQSLSLLNSDFANARARRLAELLQRQFESETDRVSNLFLRTTGTAAADDELAASLKFLQEQVAGYRGQPDAEIRAWCDLCQTLLIGNAAIYVD